ncbi:MAG: AraC family transcriptional regulator, partial [Brevinema sp.]
LDHACRLLAIQNLSIKDIASKVGFSDSLYFSRLFKKKYKLSPSQYYNQVLSQ